MKTTFKLSLTRSELESYVSRQLNHFFPDGQMPEAPLHAHMPGALDRLEHCFTQVRLKYYSDGSSATFDHLNTDQYAMFLYFLANTIHRAQGDLRIAAKLYALNKALHGLDAFYQIELPDIFVLQHPVGTVLGRAHYGNFLLVYQSCTVGSSPDQGYPHLGEGVVLYSGSSVLGSSRIGNNCWVSAGSRILNTEVPDNSVVFGASPNLSIKPTERSVTRDIFGKETACAPSKN